MKLTKKLWIALTCVVMMSSTFVGFTSMQAKSVTGGVAVSSITQKVQYNKPKYIFTFIGDGMSYVQLNAAQIYKGVTQNGGVNLGKLSVSRFTGYVL